MAALVPQPLEEYLPSPGISWLVKLLPQELVGDEHLRRDWEKVFTAQNLNDFTKVSGFDPHGVEEAWLAGYPLGTVFLFDARSVGSAFEAAFRRRCHALQERATGHPELIHLTAVMDDEPQALVHLRGHFIAVARRDITLAKIIVADAKGKLESVPAAMSTRFLAPFATVEPRAPVRLFLAGPFKEATDPIAMEFVSGGAAVSVRNGRLEVQANALGLWPNDREGPAALDDWLAQLLHTREMRALGLGFPVEPLRTSCRLSDVVKDTTLTQCVLQGSWSSPEVAEAVYRITSAPLDEMLPSTNPERWRPAASLEDDDQEPVSSALPAPETAP